MEQRNYTDHNDIRPIEDLFGGKKTPPPEPYNSGKRFYDELPEPKPQPQSQPLRAQPVVGNSYNKPGVREDFTLEPPEKKLTGKRHASPKVGHRSPALWGLLGFAIGVAFWHFVGFWNFMEDAVLRTPNPQQSQLSASVLQRQNHAQNTQTNSNNVAIPIPVTENLNACMTLVMDRNSRQTFAVQCKPGVRFFYRNRALQTAARITN